MCSIASHIIERECWCSGEREAVNGTAKMYAQAVSSWFLTHRFLLELPLFTEDSHNITRLFYFSIFVFWRLICRDFLALLKTAESCNDRQIVLVSFQCCCASIKILIFASFGQMIGPVSGKWRISNEFIRNDLASVSWVRLISGFYAASSIMKLCFFTMQEKKGKKRNSKEKRIKHKKDRKPEIIYN